MGATSLMRLGMLLVFVATHTVGHLINIDHHEFRGSGFARSALVPPLPLTDQLPQHLIAKELTAAELMVDLTNDLTFRILHYHSILNRNNFAFSPTALMSVLVALYEGSAGRSTLELRNVLQLPSNRDLIRVGYRDIHRRLRTYFFGPENPLKGLSLNRENVTITRDYETVLMFYGYDLGMDMVSTRAPPQPPDTTQATATIAETEEPTTTTPLPNIPSATEALLVTDLPIIVEDTTLADTTAATAVPTTELPASDLSGMQPTTIEVTTTEVPTTEMLTTQAASTESPIETTTVPVTTESSAAEAAELVSNFKGVPDAEPLLRIQKAKVTRIPSAKLQAPLRALKPKGSYLPVGRMSSPNRSNRSRRHLVGFKELDANLFVSLFNKPPSLVHDVASLVGPGDELAQLTNDYEFDVEPHFLSTGPSRHNYNTDVISHVFYLGNQQIIHTTFKVYNAVLYHKYFETLRMNVLELELDTPEYNLMILLPDTDMVAAAAALRLGPTLRLMRKQLRPRWVQAIIPDFKLFGTMFLTNDLQNMGICDIFEPNRADFRPMTDEKAIYVRHIEQLINVNIRTHSINQLRRNYGSQTQPIQLSVNHPFLFFIIDRDLDVAVMAGRVLNPLNVRIQ